MSDKELTDKVGDIIMDIYNKGMLKGAEHLTPSDDTKKFIDKFNIINVKMENRMENLEKKVDDILVFMKSMDKRYASKLTQTIVYGVGSLIGIGFVTAVIVSVISKAQF